MPLTKICGVTLESQATAIAAMGADAIGLNFVQGAARQIALPEAVQIVEKLKGRVDLVAVFMDASHQWVEQVLERCPVDYLQFHGSEPARECERFGVPYLKAVAMREADDALRAARSHPAARALLLDAYVGGQSGGTGQSFDWSIWPTSLDTNLLLAGGLTPDNVAEAIARTHPCGVDVSGGVESGTKGVKDLAKVSAFIEAARSST